MSIRISTLLFIVLVANTLTAQTDFSTHLHVDQFGYLPAAEKVAVLNDPVVGYNSGDSYEAPTMLQLIDAITGNVIFSAAPTAFNAGVVDDKAGDRGWWFDFSEVTTPGDYYVYDPVNELRSAEFAINGNVYLPVLKDAGRMYFYNRCNFPKAAPFAEANWTDGNNFPQDATARYIYDQENTALERELTGGWFDAGDYNKYVTFTESTLHHLLSAYEENPQAFGDDWNLPESGNGIPDLIDEVKWELDWLLKMANEDGSIHLKMGSRNYAENTASPPSANTSDLRYYGPTCTSASATMASVLGHAALVCRFIEGLEGYATTLGEVAASTFAYARTRAENNTLELNCDDGSIVAGDADRTTDQQITSLVIAAVYLYELTQEEGYHDFFQARYNTIEPISNNFWGGDSPIINDALLRYLNVPGAVAGIQNDIANSATNNVNQNNNGFWGWSDNNSLYRAYGAPWTYYWGSNRPMANYGTINFRMANAGIGNDGPNLRRKGLEQLHYFHGVNPLGMVMLSNMYIRGGDRCVNEIYHTWFYDDTEYDHALNSPKGPAPGYLTGGPNAGFSVTTISPPAGQPDLKSYLDFNDGWPESSWEISEPAIYYQAAYLRLLAHSVPSSEPVSSTREASTPISLTAFPNPAASWLRVNVPAGRYQLRLLDTGGKVLRISTYQAGDDISVSGLPATTYLLELVDDAGKLYQAKWVKG